MDNLTKTQKQILLGFLTCAVITEIHITASILKLISRSNKALKIYIDKNKKPSRRSMKKVLQENDYYEDDIVF